MRFFVSGKEIHEIPRTLFFGEGVFETFRWKKRSPVFFNDHYQRLVRGAELLHLPVPERSEVMDAVKTALKATGIKDARVKICLISYGDPTLDSKAKSAKLLVGVSPYSMGKPEMKVHLVSFRRSSSSPLLRIKSINYLENLIGHREAKLSGSDEGLFLNELGEVAEGCTTNIFWVKRSVLFTPHPDCGILPGIIRKAMISLAPKVGLRVKETRSHLRELFSADLVFLTNSIIGVARVSEIDGKKLPWNQELFSRLRDKLFATLGWK